MKTQIIQCADRPRVERHGQQLVITFSDLNNSKCELEINQSQAWCLAQDIMEAINESTPEPNLHPVFQGILKRFGQA